MSATRARTLLALHLLLLCYSLADVASKLAAGFEPLGWGFVACYGAMLVVLAGYALGWQQVIKRLPLTTAYANRGITVVWGVLWGAILFGEGITAGKLAGAAMICVGIALFSRADAEDDRQGRVRGTRGTDGASPAGNADGGSPSPTGSPSPGGAHSPDGRPSVSGQPSPVGSPSPAGRPSPATTPRSARRPADPEGGDAP